MYTLRKCVICGKPFGSSHAKKLTCSPECAKFRKKQTRAQWLEEHPGYMSKYFKEHKDRYSRAQRRQRKGVE